MISSLYLSATKTTPEVKFEPNGNLLWRGEAFPEDARSYFQPILAWLRAYINSTEANQVNTQTILKSQLFYFNSGSRPYILNAVTILNQLAKKGKPVHIVWEYDSTGDMDEDDINFQELIEDFQISVEYHVI
jgi:hypothetical protein